MSAQQRLAAKARGGDDLADALRLNPFENDLRALRRLMRANQFAAIEFGERTAQQMISRENRDHFDVSLMSVSSDRRAGLEGECDHDRGNQQRKRYCVVPSHFFLQEGDGEDDEHRDGNRLLNDFQLKAAKYAEAPAIGGHRKAILQQGDQPGYEDGLPKGPRVAVLKMPIPGKGHENIGTEQ